MTSCPTRSSMLIAATVRFALAAGVMSGCGAADRRNVSRCDAVVADCGEPAGFAVL